MAPTPTVEEDWRAHYKKVLPILLIQTVISLLTTITILYGGYYHCPSLPVPASDDFSSKLVYTFRCAFAPLVVLVVAIAMVGNMRRTTAAGNPLAGKDHLLQLQKNFLTNTLEQFVVFLVSTLVLITYLQGEEMRLVPLYAMTFIVGRVLFRIGYGIAFYYRSWGMMVNLFSSWFMVVQITYFMFTRGFTVGMT